MSTADYPLPPSCYLFSATLSMTGYLCSSLRCRRPDAGHTTSLHGCVPAQRLWKQPKHIPSYSLQFFSLCLCNRACHVQQQSQTCKSAVLFLRDDFITQGDSFLNCSCFFFSLDDKDIFPTFRQLYSRIH